MKIRAVRANNRRKAFELATAKARFLYPFAKLDPRPSPGDPIVKAWVDKELASLRSASQVEYLGKYADMAASAVPAAKSALASK